MGTGVVLPDILALHAPAVLTLMPVFFVGYADIKKPFYESVVDAFASLDAHAGEVHLFGAAHDLNGIPVCTVSKTRSNSLNLP